MGNDREWRKRSINCTQILGLLLAVMLRDSRQTKRNKISGSMPQIYIHAYIINYQVSWIQRADSMQQHRISMIYIRGKRYIGVESKANYDGVQVLNLWTGFKAPTSCAERIKHAIKRLNAIFNTRNLFSYVKVLITCEWMSLKEILAIIFHYGNAYYDIFHTHTRRNKRLAQYDKSRD